MDKKELIMGIDPGTKITGYGIIEKRGSSYLLIESGVIKPSYNLSVNDRYLKIFHSLELLIKKYDPISIAIETQFVKKNIQTAIKLGMARGVAIIAAANNNIPVYEYAPKKAKLAVVGNGMASKEQVQKMVKMLLNINKNISFDEADALALAICHSHKVEVNYV
ncbi:MAG: hypothetical protein AMS24_03680 [Chlamydiae bacterium SM23_39]|nr:MAG: hypothetical protein AMS24_03680 [Chlamydiae bacterium SM23_39]